MVREFVPHCSCSRERSCFVIFWPSARAKCHSRWCPGRKWHIPMAVMWGNRVGGNWLMKWDELITVGSKYYSLCSVSSSLLHANPEQPFVPLQIKWEVNICKEVFLCLSAWVCLCHCVLIIVSLWCCRWAYNSFYESLRSIQ